MFQNYFFKSKTLASSFINYHNVVLNPGGGWGVGVGVGVGGMGNKHAVLAAI